MIFELGTLPEPTPVGVRKGHVHLTDNGHTALCGYRLPPDRILNPIGDYCERCTAARDGQARLHRQLGGSGVV